MLLEKRIQEMKLDDMCIVKVSPLMSDRYIRILPKNGSFFKVKMIRTLRGAFPLDADRVTNAVVHNNPNYNKYADTLESEALVREATEIVTDFEKGIRNE